MHIKRTTFPTGMKIGVHLEELKQYPEIGTFLLLECSPIRKKPICLKMQIYIERIGESTILMHFHTVIPDLRSTGELENILTTNCRWFSSSVKLWEVVF